ncbi:hypothetical protein V6N11_080928 [Hibiscus sabdariffa]|uniref:CCHC-type domain-containing protein n=1 Tax=Hibiscus sabdariffa TaxID=183260 RepID=A0ABR2QIC9_9ROSI
MDCDSFPSETTVLPVSYKDVVTGGTSIHDDSILFDDDDFDFLDEDINCGIKDGIPFIDFSARVQELMTKSMEYAIVLKVLGRRVGYTTLYNRLLHIWKSEKPIRLTYIENDYYIVRFSSQTDYLAALTDGPWTIFGHYITVEPWSPEFDPSQSYPRRILAWIRLPGLPITWYKRSLLEAIGSCVGSVVKIDFQMDNGRHGRFAHMAVKINLNQPLVSKIVVNGRTQLVEYESLPVVCFQCGTYGHVHDQCPRCWTLKSLHNIPIPLVSTLPQSLSHARAPIIPPVPKSHPITATSNANSGARSKSVGVLRKHNPVVLGSRNLNIMPSKPSVGASSSSLKLNKGRHVHKPLNSERHTTVTLDPVDPPISAKKPVPQSKHPSIGFALAGENLMHLDSSNPEPGNMNSGRSAMME